MLNGGNIWHRLNFVVISAKQYRSGTWNCIRYFKEAEKHAYWIYDQFGGGMV